MFIEVEVIYSRAIYVVNLACVKNKIGKPLDWILIIKPNLLKIDTIIYIPCNFYIILFWFFTGGFTKREEAQCRGSLL